MPDAQPSDRIIDRVSALLKQTPRGWTRVAGGGYTPAQRWLARLSDQSVFVKIAPTPITHRMMRHEHLVYETMRENFMPRAIAWQDDEAEPLLILEDLSAGHWPPPWMANHIDAALAMLERVHACRAPHLPGCALKPSWPKVAANPAPFLALGLVSADWLTAALPDLIAAEAACPVEGDALCHFDIRSDNMCFMPDGRALLIDWAEGCQGNPNVDTGTWLASLAQEGGPLPDDILPNRPDIAAIMCGYFAARAGLPAIPDAPRVRQVQREQLSTALAWTIRALRLPEP